jgi:hypothetical protein
MGVMWIEDDPEIKDALEKARAALGETAYQSAWEAGQSMGLDDAIEFALIDEVVAE